MKSLKPTVLAILLILSSSCQLSQKVILADQSREDLSTVESTGKDFAISTQGRYATLAAKEMFALGGNIVDATVAASFVISVERPQSTGIGGGGFLVFRRNDGETYAIDFRERAPLKAFKNMYVTNGKADTQKSQNGILATATPGLVAGLTEIHKKFGSLPLNTVVQPAIDLAENGFPIYPRLEEALVGKSEILKKNPAARKIFLDSNENPWPLHHLLVQKDLARTLKLIARNGRKGFYKGEIGDRISNFFSQNKGLLTQKDLNSYEVKWRKPVTGFFHDYEIISMPPPSSGGVHVIQFLKFLEHDNLKEKGVLSLESIHLGASSLQSAFADRAKYLGDPDFVKVPTNKLISSQYNLSRRKEVRLNRVRKANEVTFGKIDIKESTETTHISIMDSKGNAISTTQTVNGWFGAGIVVPETGILLNNEMDDFSIQNGVANLFGAMGGDSNSIAPEKTPLSSMSPTILVKNGQAIMSVGAPGGTRIISCVAETILNYTEFGLTLRQSISAIRYHHQWLPDILTIDPPGPEPKVLKGLQKMGYDVEIKPVPCIVMGVTKEGETLRAVADPRDIGIGLAQ